MIVLIDYPHDPNNQETDVTLPKALKGSLVSRTAILGLVTLSVVMTAPEAGAQQTCVRIMKQDSTLNNLVDPPGYKTAPLGTLGGVLKSGTGPQDMILIPGLGFSGDVFQELMSSWGDKYRMFAVTLPGFGGSAAPPCPAATVSFGEQTWTNNALAAIEKLIKDENIKNPIVVGHWLVGAQLAMRLAMAHPDEVKAVILFSGSTHFVPSDTTKWPLHMTLERRVAGVDRYMAPRWFATVTRETWDDNNFLPADYAVHPLRGLRLWREAFEPPLHVWVRYLCEYHAQDISLDFGKVTTPTLVLNPGLEGLFVESGANYMYGFTAAGWEGAEAANPRIKIVTIPDSRACLWFDQPERVNAAVQEFLQTIK